MQRFELAEGTSNKFWEVDASGTELTVRFGRVGTAGQSKTKVFADAQAAIKERDKLIREKAAKGYMSVGPAGGESVDAGSSVAAEVTPASAPTPGQSQTNSPASVPAKNKPILWPTGGYQWQPQWRAQLPVVRGVHVPPMDPPKLPIEKCIPTWTPENVVFTSPRIKELTDRYESDRQRWLRAIGTRQLRSQDLTEPQVDTWLALITQCEALATDDRSSSAAFRSGLALHGPALMLEVAMAMADVAPSELDMFSVEFRTLRHAIACADETQHAAALAVAERGRHDSFARTLLCLDVFPHMESWALEFIHSAGGRHSDRLNRCILPAELTLRHFAQKRWLTVYGIQAELYLHIALHGEGALPLLTLVLQRAERDHELLSALELLRPMQSPGVPAALATRLDHKLVRDELESLAERYPAAVILVVIERTQALSNPSLSRWALRLALQHPDALPSALAALPEDARLRFLAEQTRLAPNEAASDALPDWLNAPTPRRKRTLPTWFVAGSLHRPVLKSGGSLPLPAVERLASMLAASTLEQPDPGLAAARADCTADSLARFAWDLFDTWDTEGCPSKENWAFLALGFFGDDETARRLTPKIRAWPGESAHQRAVLGLDLLATIGSDVALMHLNGIANKLKFKALQSRAAEKIQAVAAARGLTADELADRLVPDLGLDESGGLTLDFGPRQFKINFDEALKPFVSDSSGQRLKDLPKPLKSDDATLAEAATERYKQIKKDAKAVGSLQATRLELAMVSRRRWTGAGFKLLFLNHPLMRHLAARLVWGVYEPGTQGRLERCVRVAEDWTLADEHDHTTTLSDDAVVGIAHVLDMPEAMQTTFGQLLADYEILQPFKQLGRETFSLTEAEAASQSLTRFNAKRVTPGGLMGLTGRGWQRGQALDGGGFYEFNKPLPGGLWADLVFSPGLTVGLLDDGGTQTLDGVWLRRPQPDANKGKPEFLKFETLDPVLASELLRDIDLIAPWKAPE